MFSEVLKTYDSGQFSYFTALPGVTRGNHYHHTKNEKFVVIKGNAVFRFQHIISKEECTLVVNGDGSCVVESIPGWAHSVTNIGEDELIVMIWASENFDRNSPDTISMRVDHE